MRTATAERVLKSAEKIVNESAAGKKFEPEVLHWACTLVLSNFRRTHPITRFELLTPPEELSHGQ